MKIWARLITDQKIKKDTVYASDLPMKYHCYEIWVREICDLLDVPTPVVLPAHYKNFVRFHNTRFKQDDFVESLGYDMLMLEDCKES